VRRSALARWTLGYSWLAALVAVQFIDPLPQDPTYHDFAATGSWLGIPNAGNVLTNLAFLVAGIWGLRSLVRTSGWPSLRAARLPEAVFFAGLALTGLGSGTYHLAPNDAGLAWDRLAMTVAFMALYVSLLGHCLDPRLARLLPLALLAGAASVGWWAWTEASGAGDLRYYVLVQFLPILLIPWMLLRWQPVALDRRWLWVMLGLYLAAKACELLDSELAAALPAGFSGHAIKHLFAGAAGLAFARALPSPARRLPRSRPPRGHPRRESRPG